MSKFTPGEWKYLDELKQVVAYPDGPGNWPIVGGLPSFPVEAPDWWKDITGELCGTGDEIDANGRLIAAAPEMYKLLKEELIPTSDYGELLSLSRADKVHKLLARIDVEDADE